MAKQLPQKLDELHTLLDEVGMGWLLKKLIRVCVDKIGRIRLADKLAECADAAVDDYFTSPAAEWAIEPKFRKLAVDWVNQLFDELDRWAR